MRLLTSLFILSMLLVSPALARNSVQKTIGSWLAARSVLDDGVFSCQAIQCTSGDCAQNRFFLLVTAPGETRIFPMFNNGWEVPNGTAVALTINGQTFTLGNGSGKPDKFLRARSLSDVKAILKALEAIDGTSSSVFHVTGPDGARSRFHARGTSKTIDFMAKQCDLDRP